MQRLVTQFDDSRTKSTVATPTCSSCCCCCCCVASILTSSSLTAMNVRELGRQNNIEPRRITLYTVGAILVFPLAVALTAGLFLFSISPRFSFFLNDSLPGAGFFEPAVTLIIWILLLKLLYNKVGLHKTAKIISISIVASIILLVADVVGAVGIVIYASSIVSESGGSGWYGVPVYLVLATIVSYFLVRLLRKITHSSLSLVNVDTPPPPVALVEQPRVAVVSEAQPTHTVSNDQAPVPVDDQQPPPPPQS